MSNFEFLNEKWPKLAKMGELAEQYVYTDSNTCFIKLGLMAEHIVEYMLAYEGIVQPKKENTHANRINLLRKNDLLPKEIDDILFILRKSRNDAAHAGMESLDKAKRNLRLTYQLASWYMQTYGDFKYVPKDFQMPEDKRIDLAELEKKNKEQEIYIKDLKLELQKLQKSGRASTERKTKAFENAKRYMLSEHDTRMFIDAQLREVGWEADTDNLKQLKGVKPEKGHNRAIAEWRTDSAAGTWGRVDYALFVGTQMVGIIEAKKSYLDIPSVIDGQCKEYASHIRKEDREQYCIKDYGDYAVPFLFATNGRPYLKQIETKSGIWSLDVRNGEAPKALSGWKSPEGLLEELKQDIGAANKKLKNMDYTVLENEDGLNLRYYQIEAIKAAEKAILEGKRELLLAMATGTGKTRTVLGMIYRFLSTKRFRSILFLVDRTSLGEQAIDTFKEVQLEDLKSLDKIFPIKELGDKELDRATRVHVATVQSMIKRILYGHGNKPAVSDYDLIIVDEAHRGYSLDRELDEVELLYRDQKEFMSKYRAVIEYFDAVKIGLTATPALHTKEIFQSLVYAYTYRDAVVDGYLIDHDAPHNIKTNLGHEGIKFKEGETVPRYNPVTNVIENGEELEDELHFEVENFNRQVITENFNRVVLREIFLPEHPTKDHPGIDPEDKMQGKTLIFAVDDAHADLIVKILKEMYAEVGVDEGYIRKITSSISKDKKKVLEAIRHFKNDTKPSIVVTVDLLTTGIDVEEITRLVFLRRVKSRILFEQMLGRATRLCDEISKDHFEIYDAVGVYDALEPINNMKPVVVQPKVTFEEIIEGFSVLETEEQKQNQMDILMAKLRRKEKRMTTEQKKQFENLSGGWNVQHFIEKVREYEMDEAVTFIENNKTVFNVFEKNVYIPVKKFVSFHEDSLLEHTRGYGDTERPEDYIEEFKEFITSHMNEIEALAIVCQRPKDLTREALKSLKRELDKNSFNVRMLNAAWNEITNQDITADIIGFIRQQALGDVLISHEERIKRAIMKVKNNHPDLNVIQTKWLERIEMQLLKENDAIFNRETFELPAFKNNGGYKKVDRVFGNKLDDLIEEINDALYESA